MKFLVFNLAVAAALVFLFAADRGDVQKMAGQVHDAAADVKAYAKRTLHKGQNILEPGPAATPAPAKPAPVRPAVQTKEPPRPVPAPPPPRQTREIAEAAPTLSPSALKPDVAQRRQEVLAGIPPSAPAAPSVAAPTLKEGTRLMTASDRRKELLSLAEEMELLYARSISR